ncbi:MAG: cytochrome c biogenesis protein ResB [Thermodesulfobacteriota bacterium]|nr:cytochrome c biogenesis protein ResB [Thermodesulfobacteriota bacterium]
MIKKLHKLFSSVKLTIFLFLFIAATSILGTIIQQGMPIERYKALYSSGVFSVLKFFNIFDMYHSWWFTTLLLLLSINIIVCTFNQVPRIIRLISPEKKEVDDTIFRSSQIRKTFRSQKKLSDIEQQSEILIKSLVGTPVKTVKNATTYFFAEKGKYSRLGMIFVHISILLILAGGLTGTMLGFNGQMNIVEGEKSNTVTLFGGKGTEKLGFDVRCDDFTVEFYESGMPKEYKTDLTIIDDEKKVATGVIRVNHPFTYKGLKFCQATYGIAGVSDFLIGVKNNKTGEETVLKPNIMKKVPLPGSNASFAIARFVTDHNGMGPAVLGVLLEPEKAHDIFWIFQNGRNINQQQKRGFTFTLNDFSKLYYTGIQVSKDPGVLLVWTGFSLIIIGFMLSLFFAHKRIWLRISGSQDEYEISIAASVSKNRKTFEGNLENLTGNL